MNTLVLLLTASWAPAQGPMPMMTESPPSFGCANGGCCGNDGCCGDGGCCFCQPCPQRQPRFFKRIRCRGQSCRFRRFRRNAPCCDCCPGCCPAPCFDGCAGGGCGGPMMPGEAGPVMAPQQGVTTGYPSMPPVSEGGNSLARPMPTGQPWAADQQVLPPSAGLAQQAPIPRQTYMQPQNPQGYEGGLGPQMSEEMESPE